MYRLVLLLLTVLLVQPLLSSGQDAGSIKVPAFDDKYTAFVKQLEAGTINIDYQEFRNSFLDSKQFVEKAKQKNLFDSLKKEVYKQIKEKNYKGVVAFTQEMLGIDYTSMFAHKYLYQTYKILGDTVNQNKYHDIEMGLLTSIIKSGDGKTCETAWQVVQIEEEYFILSMAGVTLQQQSIDHAKNNICDKMQVKTEEGGDKVYYFGVNKIFEQYSKHQ